MVLMVVMLFLMVWWNAVPEPGTEQVGKNLEGRFLVGCRALSKSGAKNQTNKQTRVVLYLRTNELPVPSVCHRWQRGVSRTLWLGMLCKQIYAADWATGVFLPVPWLCVTIG
jgi:hypothetical protein